MDEVLYTEVERFCSELYQAIDVSNVKEALKEQSVDFKLSDASPNLSSLEDIRVAKWTDQERNRLIDLVRHFTANEKVDWTSVAASLHDKEPMECLMSYRNADDPMINISSWTAEEDTLLSSLASHHSQHNWCAIATALGSNRTPLACLQRYQTYLNPQAVREGEWTAEEDAQLLEAVELYGTNNWTHVSNALHLRAASQCLNRHRILTQKTKGAWSADEERRLVLSYLANSLQISAAVENEQRDVPTIRWCNVAKYVPTRNDSQCREKWMNVLNPRLSVTPFTAEEDAIILQHAPVTSSGGSNRWSDIAGMLIGRTDNQVWRRWQQLTEEALAAEYKLAASKRKVVLPKVYQRKRSRPVLSSDNYEAVVAVKDNR